MVRAKPFGKLSDGRPVTLYELTNARGIRAEVTDYGGILTSFWAPDAGGAMDDIVLGYDRLEGYLVDPFFMGCLVGRYANRIGNGTFSIDGRSFALTKNDGPNHLHGGPRGFHNALWESRSFEDAGRAGVTLSHRSPDGHEGYPGNLAVTVDYWLTGDNELYIDYRATTDKSTVVNFTQHSYFNLAGRTGEGILDHEMMLRAARFTPTDASLIPTGELRDVAETSFDLRHPKRIGSQMTDENEQLRLAGGYDHNWVLEGPAGTLRPVGRVRHPPSGRVLEVATTEPGIQLYTGNMLSPRARGKGGIPFTKWSGLCLETQHFPDSPNKSKFPSTLLTPGETYRSTTVYRLVAP